MPPEKHYMATAHMSMGNPFLNSPWTGKGRSWGVGHYAVGAAPVSVLLSLGHNTAAGTGEGFRYRHFWTLGRRSSNQDELCRSIILLEPFERAT